MIVGPYVAGGQVPDDRAKVVRLHGIAMPADVAERLGLDEHQADVDGADAPPPAPAPSLVSGAIGRGLVDAQQSYRAQLDQLWADVVAALPDD